jgi:hypothetical protein
MRIATGNTVMVMIGDFIQRFVMASNQQAGLS